MIVSKKKIQRNIFDLTAVDKNQRNILHRACLEQQLKLIQTICQDFKIIKQEDFLEDILMRNQKNKKIQDKIDSQEKQNLLLQQIELKKQEKQLQNQIENQTKLEFELYINCLDQYGNSPLLNLCQSDLKNSQTDRQLCIQYLIDQKANINITNKNKLWSCIFWVAYYGDIESTKILVENKCELFKPDNLGFYPLDMAGQQKNIEVSSIIVAELIKNQKSLGLDSIEYNQNQKQFLDSPLLKLSMLYWTCLLKLDIEFLKQIIKLNNLYFFMPYYQYDSYNVFHACAKVTNLQAIKILLPIINTNFKIIFKRIKNKNFIQFKHNQLSNEIFSFSKEEYKSYHKQFKKQIEKYDLWIFKFLQQIRATENDNYETIKYDYINQKDFYHNNPLHYANLSGSVEMVEILLSNKVNAELENKEGILPNQFIVLEDIKKIYEQDQQNKSQSQKNDINNQIQQLIDSYIDSNLQKKKNQKVVGNNNLIKSTTSQFNIDFKDFQLVNIDFVIKFNLKPSLQLFKQLTEQQQIQRINFYIQQLLTAKFDVYICESYNKEHLYAMLTLSNKILEEQMINQKLRVKLFEGFEYEQYKPANKQLYEPLKSSQRQTIIQNLMDKFIDLQFLQSQGLIDSFFLMHNEAGIKKMNSKWIRNTVYKQQPLLQMMDYIKEGKECSFNSITILKQYFGERLGFLFAWNSYLTCFLTLQVIPGLALFIYNNLVTKPKDYIITFWAIYCVILQTFIYEFWKRKESEINVRWGTLDYLMDNKTKKEEVFRKEFEGDDVINQITGEKVKMKFYQNKFQKYFKYIAFIILMCLIGLVIFMFITIKAQIDKESLKKNDIKDGREKIFNQAVIILLSFGNSMQIVIINTIYKILANIFNDLENHKFQNDYDQSMSLKLFPFMFFSGLLGISYQTFIDSQDQNKDNITQKISISGMSNQLIPLVITITIAQIIGQTIPLLLYHYKCINYFQYIKENEGREQIIDSQKEPESKHEINSNEDIVSQGIQERIVNNKCLRRAVLSLKQNEAILVNNLDIDLIELNSFKSKLEKVDIIEVYANGLLKQSYLIIFSVIFPLGSLFIVVLMIFELRLFLYFLTTCYQRPLAEKITDIGVFQSFWNIISYIGIFSNVYLMYVMDSFYFTDFYDSNTNSKIYVYIVIVIVLISIKFIIQKLISDIPKWVKDRYTKNQIQKKGKKDISQKKENINQVKKQSSINKNKIYNSLADQNNNKNVNQYLKKINGLMQDKKLLEEQIQQISNNQKIIVVEKNYNDDYEYDGKLFGIFKYTQLFLENQVIMKRIKQQNNFEKQIKQICQQCDDQMAILYCENCLQNQCLYCFKQIHNNNNKNHSKLHFLINLQVFNDQLQQKFELIEIYNSINQKVQKEQLHDQKNKVLNKKISQFEIKDYDPSQINSLNQCKKCNWKKFQYFSIPTEIESFFIEDLINIFEILKKIYIIDKNIISSENIFNLNSFLKYNEDKKVPDYKINENEKLFLDFNQFNNEDKLFINRLAFLCFRRLKQNAQFSDLQQLCQILVNGTISQKCSLLADILDNGNNLVSKFEFEIFVSCTFIKDINNKLQLEDISTFIFQEFQYLEKQNFINNIFNNTIVTLFVCELLQNNKQ